MRIVDQDGNEPLRNPDEPERVRAFFVAAAAPQLVHFASLLAARFEYLQAQRGYHLKHDDRLLQQVWGAIIVSRPTAGELASMLNRNRQQELFGQEA